MDKYSLFCRAECVRWLSESLRPFEILEDRGFWSLMKTGRPQTYMPSASTASRDTKLVFARVRKRLSQCFNDYEGALNFQADCWSSPNHKPYMGLTVSFEHKGELFTLPLDVIELSTVHCHISSDDLPMLTTIISSHTLELHWPLHLQQFWRNLESRIRYATAILLHQCCTDKICYRF